jgi:proteasome lid subunit RPN8/RPN11
MSKRAQEPVGPILEIDNEVTRRIRQHARSHMTTEVCGVLIGDKRNNVIEVRASIEASNAAQAGTHVTFTQDAWESIYRVKDESYPKERIIGWYHSHPGFGVFLSEHDLFIQRNFFSSPDQVAWVYDPHTDEEGCFGWIDGDVHRISNFSVVDNNGDGVERTPKELEEALPEGAESRGESGPAGAHGMSPAWIRWGTTALKYLSAMMLGFAIAYFLFPRFYLVAINPLTGEPMLVRPQGPIPQPGEVPPDPNAGRSK